MAVIHPDSTARFLTRNVTVQNPHIGFTTFQRFNGDKLNPLECRKWTEGFPIEYQPFRGDLHNENYPDTTIAYFRFYWRFFEPEDGQYQFEMLDKALETANIRGQTLMIRMAPHGTEPNTDTPEWYRKLSGDPDRGERDYFRPTSPVFFDRFTRAIQAIGDRYDKDPRLDSVDMAVYGQWGEGAGNLELPYERRLELVDAYTNAFRETPLMGLINAPDLIQYANQTRPVGYRADCLGDLSTWHHMVDYYPRHIAPIQEVWKKAPVSFEVCWVVQHWLDMGWDIDYTIEQSLKWHISTFNAKSSAIPSEWESNVNEWLKRMGYRLCLRFVDYPSKAEACDIVQLGFWMENTGVAPCYRPYPMILRLKNEQREYNFRLNRDVRDLLPGDHLWKEEITLPDDILAGHYELSFAITDKSGKTPVITMPIDGENREGWTILGKVEIV